MILFASLFLAVYQTVNGTCATYYAQYILGNNEYYSVLNLAENIPQVAIIMIFAPFIKKFGSGIAGAIVGKLMGMSGFTGLAQEIPSAVSMVENLYIWGTVFAWAIIIVLMLTYKLDKEYNGILGDMKKKGMLKQAD